MDIDSGISQDYLPMDPKRLLERIHTALNTRDITYLLACFQVDYEQVYPAEQGKDTLGVEAARSAWEGFFNSNPDLQAELIRQAIDGNTIWTEWRFRASSGERAGVIVLGVEEGLIAWSRNYLIGVPAGA
jgi:limonene-1,2-epoxide hydrolase